MSSGKGLCLTVYPWSLPNMDTILDLHSSTRSPPSNEKWVFCDGTNTQTSHAHRDIETELTDSVKIPRMGDTESLSVCK